MVARGLQACVYGAVALHLHTLSLRVPSDLPSVVSLHVAETHSRPIAANRFLRSWFCRWRGGVRPWGRPRVCWPL